MAGGVIYLDIDDEITSAAARIRGVEGYRVAVVLPHGSRVATSRINFRLLARDALTHEKRLSIVASDPATRALAASAGLPIFASVAEYEASVDAERDERDRQDVADAGEGRAGAAHVAGAAALAGSGTSGTGAAAGAAAAIGAAGAIDTSSVTVGRPAARPEASADAPATPVPPTRAPSRSKPTAVAAAALPATTADGPPPSPRTDRVERAARGGIGRGPIAIGLAVLVLAALVGGVGAYLLLPSATVVVTARQETIGPLPMTIVAATDVTEPDAERGIVPAEVVDIPVDASDTFPATGKRVELTAATGSVRFSNLDPTSPNTIAKGSIVSTQSGIRFRTGSTITVDAARLEGLTIIPSTRNVRVTAVEKGPDGNVPPNTITAIPRGEEPILLRVTNPEATSGGKRQEFKRVNQKDVDAATAALTDALSAAFQARLADPDLVTDGATVFPETASLGDPVFATDPADLVGQEVESFDLAASSSGTVTAVDDAPVQGIAEQRLASSIDDGYELVEDSGDIKISDAVVVDDNITFPVIATAKEVKLLDAAAIKAAIMGKPQAEAQAILDGFGPSDFILWPDWVTTVPTLDDRVSVEVTGPVAVETPEPEASPSGDSP